MYPINPGCANFTFKAPQGREGEVLDLHGFKDADGFRSYWRPSAEELRLLNEGCALELMVHGAGHPVVSFGVTAEPVEEE